MCFSVPAAGVLILSGFCFTLLCGRAFATFATEVKATVIALQPAMNEAMNKEATLAGVSQRAAAAFPEKGRTGVQAWVLGNSLLPIDPKASAAFHKEAAKKLPSERSALISWAIDQQRAGDFTHALETWDAISALNPGYAPAHYCAAECLIQLGKSKLAVDRWKKYQTASIGPLTNTGSPVDESVDAVRSLIHLDLLVYKRRTEAVLKAMRGDVDALVTAVAIDADYDESLNNGKPNKAQLAGYPAAMKDQPDPRMKAAACVCRGVRIYQPKQAQIETILREGGFVIDSAKTLPENYCLARHLLSLAVSARLATAADCREQYGPALLAKAKEAKSDRDLWSLVAYLYLGQPEMPEINKLAWQGTGQSNYAADYLGDLAYSKSLKADNPFLVKALTQFPNDAVIQGLGMELKQPLSQPALIQAIKAEFHRSGTDVPSLYSNRKPGALDDYFVKLEGLMSR